MKLTGKTVLLLASLALAACTNADRFGSTGGAGGAAGAAGPLGSPSDPTSIAYFNQTVGDRVLFAVDQSSISDAGRITLDGQAKWLIDNTP